MSYRGPQKNRIARQFNEIRQYAGVTATYCVYVSASTGTASGVWAGLGTERYYQNSTITALFAAPQMGEARFRETQLPGGQVVAGDVVLSLPVKVGQQDKIEYNGVTYRVEGDATPITYGGTVWYRTVLRRGDVTG